jgi:hypothetical protein
VLDAVAKQGAGFRSLKDAWADTTPSKLAVETWRRAVGEAGDLGSVGKLSVMSRRMN